MTRALVVALIAALLCPSLALAAFERSAVPLRAFAKRQACPANGLHRYPCPGYVVDHIVPLCAGGADAISNMQWQAYAESLLKDRDERALCAWVRRAQPKQQQP